MRSWMKYFIVVGVGASGCAHVAIKPSQPALQHVAAKVIPQIEALAADYGFSEDDSWVLRDAPLIDELGRVVSRFDRLHAGLRVVGGDVITHSELGDALSVERFISPLTKPITVPLQPQVTEVAAKEIASGTHARAQATNADLIIWAVDAYRQSPRLAWDVKVGMWQVLVAADNGKVLDEYANLHTAECGDGSHCTPAVMTFHPGYAPGRIRRTGAQRMLPDGTVDYALHNTERQIRVRASRFTRAEAPSLEVGLLLGLVDASEGTTVSSLSFMTFGNGRLYDGRDDESAPDRLTAAADLYVNLDQTYSYFADNFRRYGFDGWRTLCLHRITLRPMICMYSGHPVEATVNVPTVNAAWDPLRRQLWFGYDRLASPTWGPMVELDIVAHEYTHAVTSNTARLIYNRSHSGALNESMSDVFGRVTTFHHDPSSFDSDYAWWIGARVTSPAEAWDTALRYMDDPTLDGLSLAYLSDFPVDGIDPHYGSGIPNRAFSILAQVIGWEPASHIWYRALTTCFTESTNFQCARECTLQAASDLYPRTGPHDNTPQWVRNAWSGVGVYEVCDTLTWEAPRREPS